MNNPIAKFYQWQVNSGALDGWTIRVYFCI